MGQKTNPEILRLGKIKEWRTKHLEKKSTELALYSFFSIELEKFTIKFFEKHNLNVQSCKISISETSLHILITYISTLNVYSNISKLNEQQKIKLKFKTKIKNKKQNLVLLKKHKNYTLYHKKLATTNIVKKRLYGQFNSESKYQRAISFSPYKTNISMNRYKNFQHIKTNTFLKKIAKIAYIFTGKLLNVFVTLEPLNKNSNYKDITKNIEKKKFNSSLITLRKFEKNNFFNTGIALAYTCIKNPDSSKLIANYLKIYLTKIKRPNFFLRFFKNMLDLFIKKKASNLQQIEIKIKGRLNGVPRAKNRTIKIGTGIPKLTINSQVSFSEETAFTANGSLGIKVWTYKNNV